MKHHYIPASKEAIKTSRIILKEFMSQLEEALISYRWNNFSINKNNYIALKYIKYI